MKRIALALSLIATPLAAQDYSEGSEARSWNLFGESPAFFAATVVDPLCELAGDCADNCGDGRRLLALLRSDDDALILPTKNGQPNFAGATEELLPFCGQEVEVDGLMITDEELGAQNIYQLQKIRALGEEEWTRANRFTKAWGEKFPDSAGKGPWFRRDPRVLSQIEEEGWLGLGLDEDAKFLEEWFN